MQHNAETLTLWLSKNHVAKNRAMHIVHRNHLRTVWRRSQSHAALAVRLLFAMVVATLIYSVAFSPAMANTSAGTSDSARSIQSLASIREAAEKFIRDTASTPSQSVIATAGELDARLQLAACGGPLEIATLNKAPIAARNTVNVRCQQGANWNVYLPVSIETETDVLVLRQPAARLAHLAPADVEIQRRRVTGLGSLYVNRIEGLQQHHLKRSLPAGTVLTVDMLKRDVLVKRGQQVMLVTSVHGIQVRAAGTALADGGNADRIRVQNTASLKVVEGIVESGDLVRVGM